MAAANIAISQIRSISLTSLLAADTSLVAGLYRLQAVKTASLESAKSAALAQADKSRSSRRLK
jgi:hypothetical protein